MAKKIKVPAHRRADGTKVKAHTRHVSTKHGEREMSGKKSRRIGRQIKRGLTRLMRSARRK